MKRRRLIRGLGASEIGADGEGERQPTEERARLGRQVRGRTAAARQLLVLAIRQLHGGNPVARAHTVEWCEPLSVGRLVIEDRASRSLVRVVPHVRLEGADRSEDAHPDSWRPAEPFQKEIGDRRARAGKLTRTLPHVAPVEEGGVLDELRIESLQVEYLIVANVRDILVMVI